jgi:hypothetical protein
MQVIELFITIISFQEVNMSEGNRGKAIQRW